MEDKWLKQLLEADDPERIKKLVKKSDNDAKTAINATINLAEKELVKLHALAKADAKSLTEDAILVLRKALIAIQLFARQMIGAETLASNLERVVLNLILPMIDLCGPLSGQGAVTLKIDAISMYAKLVQAFEDMMVPFSGAILDFIVSQLDQHAAHFNGTLPLDPFEAMILRDLYSELISQSVDVCCSLVLIAPEKLSDKALPLFERSATALKIVTDINCKYELVELLAQLSWLGLKSGEEQTAEEDFLDFEMRRIQHEDTVRQEHKKSGSTASIDLNIDKPIWSAKGLSFDVLKDALASCSDLFEKEEYEDEDLDEEDAEEDEEDEEDDLSENSASPSPKAKKTAVTAKKTSTTAKTTASSGSSSDQPSFEPVKTPSTPKRDTDDQDNPNKRNQEEAGTSSVIAFLAGLSNKYFSSAEHALIFDQVYSTLSKKIFAAFATPDSYARLPVMLDSLTQLIHYSSPSLVAAHFTELSPKLEEMMKVIRVWKSEDPSPQRKRVYGLVRADILPCYSALLKASPVEALQISDHFMAVSNILFADPMILADFGASLMNNPSQLSSASSSASTPTSASTKAAASKLGDGGLLFKIVDSYLKELSSTSASVSMKKTIIQSMGKLAVGVGSVFGAMLPVVVPLFLFLGRQTPDLAPITITSLAQILYAVRNAPELVKTHLQSCVDQAIAMIVQDIIMSGFEVSSTLKKSIGAAADITFQYATKQRLQDEDDDEDDEEEEILQDDNLADIVYKGECFLAFIIHVPQLVKEISKETLETIFQTLVELELKPTLFEEDCMLKMTAVDILIQLVESSLPTHTSEHRDRAIKTFKEAGIDQFEEEVEEAIQRLEKLTF